VTRPLLTADDVARILGVPNSFVYALARRGELPTVRIGERYVRFRLDAIETWIAEHETLERRGTQ
jgi:excisionase family DNA binding protein